MFYSMLVLLSFALREIRFVRVELFDLRSTIGLCECESSARFCPRKDRRLQWTLPFLWVLLVLISYGFAWQAVVWNLPIGASSGLSPVPGISADRKEFCVRKVFDLADDESVLLALAADEDHSPVHGAEPHGKNIDREIHDSSLPANKDQDRYYGEKGPWGDPK